MTRKEKWVVGIGFAITIPFALLGLYSLYYFLWLHHMFLLGWRH